MHFRTEFLLFGLVSLGIAAIACAAVAWSRISQLSLPLPTILPALNILVPFLTALFIPLARRLALRVKDHAIRLTLPYLAHASALLPFVLLVLSLVYATPSDIQSCSLERHWLRMFEVKDARAIRNIQTNLQCCGLNSIHDRAWPFPSRNVDARACEMTQGYLVPCGERWRHQEVFAATLSAVASLLNWLAMVLVMVTLPQDEGRIRLPAWSTSTRLIEESANSAEGRANNVDNEERSEQQRVWDEPRNDAV